MESHQLINQNSGNTEWWTPRPIMEAASILMGGIDLDVACSVAAFDYHGIAKCHFSKNALSEKWTGNVWMNHPFSREENKLWVDKLLWSYTNSYIRQACCITFASMNAGWITNLKYCPMFFFNQRVNYVDPATLKTVKGVTKDSVFTYLYPETENYRTALLKLQKTFDDLGISGVAK